jgi:hypothetical protein
LFIEDFSKIGADHNPCINLERFHQVWSVNSSKGSVPQVISFVSENADEALDQKILTNRLSIPRLQVEDHLHK